ncbi:energy-coupling factor ABC transporter permease [Methanothermobacter sp. DP]|jgi:cobalt/nickel transport system permease protein|uniref:Energy-coupling factor ABC transporter permease n=1 Tax=Methanothermobacter thermautotrophicus TaxID=145262 RepID=A0A7J4MW82_METTF|nr:energy-coupling factor ABC transporter permease [Methanothermobacter sp. DP]HIH64702.1 energy-coupling factor ABC transporter permease [Methanothermobacter thermautotrophicus]
MHIPDGFIPAWQLVFYNVIATVVLFLSIAWVIRGLLSMKRDEGTHVDFTGYLLIMLTAPPLIFLIQAFCIPVPYGVPLTLNGAALLSVILKSPFLAFILMSAVMLVQSIFFGFGGVTSLGANMIGMGVPGCFLGFYIYSRATWGLGGRRVLSGFIAGFASYVLAGILTGIQLGVAGVFPLIRAVVSMGIYSATWGILEGLLTAAGCIIMSSWIERIWDLH